MDFKAVSYFFDLCASSSIIVQVAIYVQSRLTDINGHITNYPGIILTGLNSDRELVMSRFQEYYDTIGNLMPEEVTLTSKKVAWRWEILDDYFYTTTDGTKAKLNLVAMNIKWWPK